MSSTQKLSEKEALKIMDNVSKMTVDTLGITERQAKLRVRAIVESGILSKYGPPDGMVFQIAIDAAMQIPQPEQ